MEDSGGSAAKHLILRPGAPVDRAQTLRPWRQAPSLPGVAASVASRLASICGRPSRCESFAPTTILQPSFLRVAAGAPARFGVRQRTPLPRPRGLAEPLNLAAKCGCLVGEPSRSSPCPRRPGQIGPWRKMRLRFPPRLLRPPRADTGRPHLSRRNAGARVRRGGAKRTR